MSRYGYMRGFLIALPLLWAFAAQAAEEGFRVKPVEEYQSRQKQGDVTVAVDAYRGQEQQKATFDKAEPYKYGFLPVLVVIQNNTDHPLGLQALKARLIDSRHEGIERTTGDDLGYFNPKGHQPKDRPAYIPIPLGRPKVKKGPLAKPEITQREFQAPVIAPHSTASGFFYFNVGLNPDHLQGATVYLSGIKDMSTGSELFYFEIPVSGN